MTSREREAIGDCKNPLQKLIEELWEDTWEYPLSWSLYMADIPGEIGETHRGRLKAFNELLGERKRDPIKIPNGKH